MKKTIGRRGAIALFAAAGVVLSGCAGAPTVGGTSPSAAAPAEKVLEIGIAQIVDHPSLNSLREGFKEGMAQAGYADGIQVRYESRNAAGDMSTLTSIAASFEAKDLVVAIATPTAQTMAQSITDKPIFFAGVTDPVGAKLVESLEAPGGNVTGTSDYPPVADQLALIRDIAPDAKTIGLLYSSAETNSHIHAELVNQVAPTLGFEVKEATVANSSEVAQAAESLRDVDVFFVGTDNTIVSAIESVVQVAETAKIPLIVSDPDSVPRGAAAAYAVDYRAQGVQTGRMAADMLKSGRTPASVPVERVKDMKLSVNPAAAQRMGITIPEMVLKRADHTID
ncbi:MAG: ABC transporter substrate-binding protein [Propioniciclava sp.]|uniref:ABC transporter substrate-binding protein n=1 Tax=Propioniciclava sp. TaxID=2038686 RepID=UPI0039E2E72D